MYLVLPVINQIFILYILFFNRSIKFKIRMKKVRASELHLCRMDHYNGCVKFKFNNMDGFHLHEWLKIKYCLVEFIHIIWVKFTRTTIIIIVHCSGDFICYIYL